MKRFWIGALLLSLTIAVAIRAYRQDTSLPATPAGIPAQPASSATANRAPDTMLGEKPEETPESSSAPLDLRKTGNLPPGVTESWWAEARKQISKSEYAVKRRENASPFQAANRAQNLRTYFRQEGIDIIPRTGDNNWNFGLRLQQAVGTPEMVASGNTVEYRYGEITEWYVNDEKGLEQGFRIERPDSRLMTADMLRIRLAVSGDLKPAVEAGGLIFLDGHGKRTLHYDHLTAYDAAGKLLDSRMELSDDRSTISLVVDVAKANYPVTIDPIITSAYDIMLTLPVAQQYGHFGFSVASAGDVNGDGYADVVIGTPYYDQVANGSEGIAFVFYGSSTGVSSANPTTLTWVLQPGAMFGYGVAGAGDVNGDGYEDVIVGAPTYTAAGVGQTGAAVVFYGSASGLTTANPTVLTSGQPASFFGGSVSGAGDVNGDGYADVVVGAQYYDSGNSTGGLSGTGGVFIFHGGPGAVLQTASVVLSGGAGSMFGGSVSGAGDVNGDGYSDVIVGAPKYFNGQVNEGAAIVYYGSQNGIGWSVPTTVSSGQAGAWMGYSVSMAGDVNGDGYSDVIVGAPFFDNTTTGGAAFIFHGSSGGLSTSYAIKLIPTSAQSGALYGSSVAGGGDFNGDGYTDVVVGAPQYMNGQVRSNGAFVYYGGKTGVSGAPAAGMFIPGDTSDRCHVAAAGDVNGDGYVDFVFGLDWYDYAQGLTDDGAVFVYHGGATGISGSSQTLLEADQANSLFGFSVAGAGDVNGDVYSDVVVGAPAFDNGKAGEGAVFLFTGGTDGLSAFYSSMASSGRQNANLGYSVSGAFDVNGDGFADVIAGGPAIDTPGARGIAIVYYGSSYGISPMNAELLEGRPDEHFGFSVAGSGDIDGDGYAEIVVGVPEFAFDLFYPPDPAEGAFIIYFGSADGIRTDLLSAYHQSGQAGAKLGYSVAGAGDVNGDGYADTIIGAPYYDSNGFTDNGAAFVYYGGPDGPLQPNTMFPYDRSNAHAGSSVAGAGDVNGDGYADVIVGAPNHQTDGTNYPGAACVYPGSANSISTTCNSRMVSGQNGSGFGSSVAGAGDVNGDGYADIIIGAPYYPSGGLLNSGAAYVLHGSSTGIGPAGFDTLLSGQAGARFGLSVSGAGDINGDGYADVIIGAPNHTKVETNEGVALTFYGNGGEGRHVLTHQANMQMLGVTQSWGNSHSAYGFIVGMVTSAPTGTCQTKIEVEVCPDNIPFGALECRTLISDRWFSLTPSPWDFDLGMVVGETPNPLTPGALYKWRIRQLYAPYTVTKPGIIAPPKPSHGPWRRLAAQAFEADIRTNRTPTLTAQGMGQGWGRITSNTGGIDFVYMNAMSQTALSLQPGSQVVLTATADPGSTATWLYCDSSSGNATPKATCTVTLNNERNVTASFLKTSFTDFFGSPRSGFAPLFVSFSAITSIPSPAFFWDFGDGHTGSGQSPSHLYSGEGDFDVKLTVTGSSTQDVVMKHSYVMPLCSGVVIPVNIIPPAPLYTLNWLQYAYEHVIILGDTPGEIPALARVFPGDLLLNLNRKVVFKGGYDCAFSNTRIPETVVNGAVTISAGQVIFDQITIR